MFVDAIRLSHPPATPDAAPPHPANPRPRSANLSAPGVRPPASVLVPALAAPEDVKVQWDKDNGVITRFTDRKSGATVRQIPSEQMLSVARFVRQLLQEAGVATEAKASSGRNHG